MEDGLAYLRMHMKLVDWWNDEQALRGWTQWAAVYGLEPVRWRPVAGVW